MVEYLWYFLRMLFWEREMCSGGEVGVLCFHIHNEDCVWNWRSKRERFSKKKRKRKNQLIINLHSPHQASKHACIVHNMSVVCVVTRIYKKKFSSSSSCSFEHRLSLRVFFFLENFKLTCVVLLLYVYLYY